MIPTFSVVTISYNQAPFLRDSMDSVLAQEGVPIEYFVCDPGSKDGSRDIVAEYDDPRLTPLFQPDSGPADGLNKGFAAAGGDIFYYLNADDIVLPGAFATVAARFAARPEVDVVCGHALVIDAEGKPLRRVWSESFSPYAVATGAHVQVQPATFIRSTAYRKAGGFDASDRANWDGGLLASLWLSGARFETIDAFLGCYRLHAQSITMSGALADQHRINADRTFERLMGRTPGRADRLAGHALRALKHLRYPGRTLERLRKGPIFRRAS